MPVYEADEIHKILKEQKEHLLICLAEDILTRFNTKDERNDFIDRMYQRRLGPKEIYKQQADEFIKDLRERIFRVWESNK